MRKDKTQFLEELQRNLRPVYRHITPEEALFICKTVIHTLVDTVVNIGDSLLLRGLLKVVKVPGRLPGKAIPKIRLAQSLVRHVNSESPVLCQTEPPISDDDGRQMSLFLE